MGKATGGEPVYVTLEQAAARCSVSRDSLKREIAAGRLPRYRMRDRVLVKVSELDALLRGEVARVE
jgi:excisionase family DNA binding protein